MMIYSCLFKEEGEALAASLLYLEDKWLEALTHKDPIQDFSHPCSFQESYTYLFKHNSRYQQREKSLTSVVCFQERMH